jgi:phospholipid/cholesterol/gamma-HCH transport system substrate-binding protein
MKIRFNKFEKVAGVFVGLAILSCLVGTVMIAVTNGWFSYKVKYRTEIESADGIHAGTVVQIAGLRVGSVTDVELQGNDGVLVRFEVLERFREKIRSDSHVQMFRPFILAEKVLEVSVGAENNEVLEAGSTIPTISSMDVMDLLSGKKMGSMLQSFDKLADSLRIVGEAFSDKERTKALVGTLDRVAPLVNNLNTMAFEVAKIATVANKQKRIETIISNLAVVSQELERALPSFNKEVPDFGAQLGQIVKNLNVLTTEFQKLTPAISAIAPELPRTSRRAVEALDETVVLLKALQRSFLFRGKVNEVREEEGRRPANTSEP